MSLTILNRYLSYMIIISFEIRDKFLTIINIVVTIQAYFLNVSRSRRIKGL